MRKLLMMSLLLFGFMVSNGQSRSANSSSYRTALGVKFYPAGITLKHFFNAKNAGELIYGIYAAATEGVTKAWITNVAHDTNTATAVGFYTSCQSICSLLASIIAGFVWANLGSSFTFGLTAVVAFSIIIYFLLSFRKN